MNTKDRIKKVLTLAVVAMAIALTGAHQVGAAELTLGETVEVSFDKSSFNVSVYPGNASYSNVDGTVTGDFGDGTVLGYRFFNSDGVVVSSYADDGTGIVAPVVSPPADDVGSGFSWAKVWTTTDPGVDFANAADITSDTLARARNITGTIDISDLSSGKVYVIFGSYYVWTTVSLTMSGAGQTDVQAEYSIDPPNDKNRMWISSFDFSDAKGYDTITYAYTHGTARRARFMGVIVFADDPMQPSPRNEEKVPPGEVELSWTNMDPLTPGDPVYVDVYFGTDPNNLTQVVTAGVDGENTTSVLVSAPIVSGSETPYYWQVNSYLGGSPTGDPNAGTLYVFYAADLPPYSVDVGPDMITWYGQGVPLGATVGDDGVSGLDYLWSADPAPGVAVGFDPGADDPTPIVTIYKAPYSEAPIVNAGFEDPVLADGDYPFATPGWTKINDPGGSTGTWNPDATGDIWYGYGGNAPEGDNVAWVYPDPNQESGLAQVLTETFAADTTYTLTVQVGNNSYYDWLGYKVQLLAGGTVIAEDDSGIVPADDEFALLTVPYTYDEDDAALVDQPLEIRLLAASVDSLEVDTDFDDVVLTADPPFPAPAGVQTVTLTVEVTDDVGSLTDTMMIDVYGDACKAAIGAGLEPIELTDHDGNCITGLEDLVRMVAVWLDDYSVTEPVVKP